MTSTTHHHSPTTADQQQHDGSSSAFVDFSGGLQDGMSDEQLAAYLATLDD